MLIVPQQMSVDERTFETRMPSKNEKNRMSEFPDNNQNFFLRKHQITSKYHTHGKFCFEF